MRKTSSLLLLVLISLCSFIERIPPQPLSGLYNEVSPVEDHHQLKFIGGNKVIKYQNQTDNCGEFYYEIVDGKFLMTPTWTDDYDAFVSYITFNNDNSFTLKGFRATVEQDGTDLTTFQKVYSTE